MEFLLDPAEAVEGAPPDELARVLLARFGLLPRKRDGAAKMHHLLLELSERKKAANREKKPEAAVMPVEQMASFAGIARQTMYEYLRRWLDLNILKKTSFVSDGKVVIGYELNGTNIEGAFRKAESVIRSHLDHSFRLVDVLQSEIKREKLRKGEAEESNNLDDSQSPPPDASQKLD
jgi:hypothetical protein